MSSVKRNINYKLDQKLGDILCFWQCSDSCLEMGQVFCVVNGVGWPSLTEKSTWNPRPVVVDICIFAALVRSSPPPSSQRLSPFIVFQKIPGFKAALHWPPTPPIPEVLFRHKWKQLKKKLRKSFSPAEMQLFLAGSALII